MNKYAEALHLVREKEPLVQCKYHSGSRRLSVYGA